MLVEDSLPDIFKVFKDMRLERHQIFYRSSLSAITPFANYRSSPQKQFPNVASISQSSSFLEQVLANAALPLSFNP